MGVGFAGPSRVAGGPPLSLSAITAAFVPAEFATHYTVTAVDREKRKLTYKWGLTLELVDAAGATPPGVPPGAGVGAAVDQGCDNHGVLSSNTPEFVWHHGDQDGCNHDKQGPSGHQGLITVTVSDGVWSCTATYKGTNDGTGQAAVCDAYDIEVRGTSQKVKRADLVQGLPSPFVDDIVTVENLGPGRSEDSTVTLHVTWSSPILEHTAAPAFAGGDCTPEPEKIGLTSATCTLPPLDAGEHETVYVYPDPLGHAFHYGTVTVTVSVQCRALETNCTNNKATGKVRFIPG